jgi:hypothetical protein
LILTCPSIDQFDIDHPALKVPSFRPDAAELIIKHQCGGTCAQMQGLRKDEREPQMSIVLAIVGAIGIIGSLLFAGWQARVLARQVGFQATMNGVATLYTVLSSLHNVQRFLADDTPLVPHFAPERSSSPIDAADPAKVEMVAAMYADILNIGLHMLSAVPSANSESAWEPYCKDLLVKSPALKAEVAGKPWAYPRLSRLAGTLAPNEAADKL